MQTVAVFVIYWAAACLLNKARHTNHFATVQRSGVEAYVNSADHFVTCTVPHRFQVVLK